MTRRMGMGKGHLPIHRKAAEAPMTDIMPGQKKLKGEGENSELAKFSCE